MNQGRKCIIEGHELQITHVCLFQACDQHSRWLCQKCISIKMHDHGSEIQNQIVPTKQFEKMMQSFKQQRGEKRYIVNKTYDQIGKILAVSIALSTNLKQLIEFVKSVHKQKYSNAAWMQLNQTKDFSQFNFLDAKQIEQVVAACRDLNYSEDLKKYVSMLRIDLNKFDQITNSLDSLNNLNNQEDQKVLYETITLQDVFKVQSQIEQCNYQEQIIKPIFTVNAIQVSNNLKFVCAGGNFDLTIWNHQTLQVLHQFQLLNKIKILKFSFNSEILFVSSLDGYVYSFITEKSFQNNFRSRIHQSCIYQLLIINNKKNNIIFTCDMTEIRKTDCVKNANLMVIKFPAIDLDYDIVRNYLLISDSKNVSLWNVQYGYILIDKDFEGKLIYYSGIKFVGNFSQILVYFLDFGFDQYNINLKNKTFELIRQVSNVNSFKYLSFSLTQKQQFIVIFGQNVLEIRTFSGNVIKSIKHGYTSLNSQCNWYNIEQIENMKTLIVTNGIEIKLLKGV